jgi:Cof subfamily protein (haloacid dehalogenase superfamily)
MPYDLVVLDLDGTILDGSFKLDQSLVAACRRAILRGLTITIATGRMPPAAQRYWEELGITAPVVLYNGALVLDPTNGRDLYAVTLPAGLPCEVLPIIAAVPAHPLFYQNDRLYCLQLTPEVIAYCRDMGVDAEPVSEPEPFLRSGTFVKCLFTGHDDDLRTLREKLAAAVGKRACLVASRPGLLELLPAGVSKGVALRVLAGHLGVPLARVIAAGDQENDIEMISEAGMGIAMAHAPDEVKAAADCVAPPPEQGGLLALLSRLCPGYFS